MEKTWKLVISSKLFQSPVEPDWASSRPPTRPHTPSTRPHTPRTRPSTPSTRPQSPHSVHSSQVGGGRPLSRAPPRPSSPLSHSMPPSPQSNARTPPPKRWKRSFDLARTEEETDELQTVHQVGLVQETGPEFGESVAKRFCEKRYTLETEREKRMQDDQQASKRFVSPSPSQQPVMTSYPHSMPASPTMFDSRSVCLRKLVLSTQ